MKKTILIIDNKMLVIKNFCTYLKLNNFRILSTENEKIESLELPLNENLILLQKIKDYIILTIFKIKTFYTKYRSPPEFDYAVNKKLITLFL